VFCRLWRGREKTGKFRPRRGRRKYVSLIQSTADGRKKAEGVGEGRNLLAVDDLGNANEPQELLPEVKRGLELIREQWGDLFRRKGVRRGVRIDFYLLKPWENVFS